MAQPKVRKFAGDLRFWEHGANGARIPVIPEPADKFGNQPLEQSSLTFSYEAGDSVEIKSKRRDARYQQIIHKDSNPGVTSVSITALEVPGPHAVRHAGGHPGRRRHRNRRFRDRG